MLVIHLIRKRCVALPVRSMAAPTVCRLAWHDIHSSYLEPKATVRRVACSCFSRWEWRRALGFACLSYQRSLIPSSLVRRSDVGINDQRGSQHAQARRE
jgi:hypothetical protein|uniref:Uncharacterized protein n=1 Tax=Zea mays TaxID=4577 RepID=C0HDX1_MAIZE|nr:unknown [Zea mays]